MKLNDIEITEYPNSPSGGMTTIPVPPGIKVTHTPTGLFSICTIYRSQHSNKREALEDLELQLTNTKETRK
jgi:protein subunit release factor A